MGTTSSVDVGTPSKDLKGWQTTEVRFNGFADLSRTTLTYVPSPEFSCFGHQWTLEFYPGGYGNATDGFSSVFLANRSPTGIEIQWGCSVRDADCKEVVHDITRKNKFGARGSDCSDGCPDKMCSLEFAKRSKLMNSLVRGSLIIEVRMKPMSTNKSITQFIPSNPSNKNVLKLFMNEESADVVFEVDDSKSCQDGEHTNKKSKTTTNFHAHRLILKNNASTLYEMCGASDGGGVTTISITDVSPGIFKHMLYYAYGGKLSDEDLMAHAKDIIHACDKYGVVHLKLEAEACYIKSIEITMDNMMDNLLYADSKNLALLKEVVMDYILANKDGIIGKVSFSDVPGDMMTDLLTAVSRGEQNESNNGDKVNYNKMRVGVLRKMLDEKGLDVDGSRESMIALLKEHDNNDDNDD